MQKKILIGVVTLVIIAGAAYAIFHKSPTTPSTKTTSSTTTPATTAPSTTTTTAGNIIQTKTASNVGSYLADANGSALYTYGADTAGVSNCTGSCLADWPIYGPTSATTTLPANVTIFVRSDNARQYAYKGMPLYIFRGDPRGKVTGDGVSNFHVAKP